MSLITNAQSVRIIITKLTMDIVTYTLRRRSSFAWNMSPMLTVKFANPIFTKKPQKNVFQLSRSSSAKYMMDILSPSVWSVRMTTSEKTVFAKFELLVRASTTVHKMPLIEILVKDVPMDMKPTLKALPVFLPSPIVRSTLKLLRKLVAVYAKILIISTRTSVLWGPSTIVRDMSPKAGVKHVVRDPTYLPPFVKNILYVRPF